MTALTRIRALVLLVIIGLVLSGATAIPLEAELEFLVQISQADAQDSAFDAWLVEVRDGLVATNATYPFMAYGTDWLAFAHFVIAVAFIGVWRDPVKNIWVVEFAMIACVLIVPFALIMGGIRGIPWGWRLIDCSFGVVGILPLCYCRRLIRGMETELAQLKLRGG